MQHKGRVVVYLPVTMEIIKGILKLVDPEALRSGDTISVTHQGEPGAGVPLFLSLFLPCSVVSAGTAPGCRVQRELPMLLLCLPASKNLGRDVVTWAPEYFWQVLKPVFTSVSGFCPSVTSTKKMWLPVLLASCAVCRCCPCLVQQKLRVSYSTLVVVCGEQ